MPFIVLLCGLLGGALVSALVISTTLAEGAFQITNLQQSDSTLAKQQQQLEEEVATAQSAQVIEQRAYELGMRPSQLQFLNLKAGKIQSSANWSSGTGETP
jgi:pyrroline-5-carboxylate reductase